MKAALSFILLAAVAGALIGITRFSTYQTIEDNEKSARAAIISEMLRRQPDPEAHDRLCASEVRGYAGTIRFLVLPEAEEVLPEAEEVLPEAEEVLPEAEDVAQSIQQKTIAAVRVIAHTETPGIGDFIEIKKDNWILGFNALTLYTDFDATVREMNRQLDAVTGATITRRAIINGVASACLI